MRREYKTPSNRFELLKDRLRTRFFDFMLVSLLTSIFLIPYLVWVIFMNNSPFFIPTEENYLFIALVAYAPYIPCAMIVGLGVAGALYYSKRLAFNEGANASKDFFYGIGKNFGPALLSFFIIGLFYFLLSYGKIVILFSDINDLVKGVLIGLMYVAFIFIVLIMAFYLTQSILYVGNVAQLMMNAIKFTFGMIGWNLLIVLLLLVPFIFVEVVTYLPANLFLIEYFGLFFSMIFYFEFEIFVFFIYAHSIFDISLNHDYPEIYRKGLKSLEDDE